MLSMRSRKRMAMMNFSSGQQLITLTYEDEPPKKLSARRNLINFIRRLKYLTKKYGLPDLEYMAITDIDTGKPHHHIIMSQLPVEMIRKFWTYGNVISNVRGLA